MSELFYCYEFGFLVKEDDLFIKYESKRSWYSSVLFKSGIKILEYL